MRQVRIHACGLSPIIPRFRSFEQFGYMFRVTHDCFVSKSMGSVYQQQWDDNGLLIGRSMVLDWTVASRACKALASPDAEPSSFRSRWTQPELGWMVCRRVRDWAD